MVIRKKDLRSRGRMSRVVAEAEPTVPIAENVHVLRKRGGAGRWVGISLVVIILLLLGWFGTKLALSGWNFSKESLVKNLFTFGTTTLTGEDQGRVDILVAGIPGEGDDGPNLTDTLMVASLATNPDATSFLFSIPRDLYVQVPGYGNTKINAVYEIGNNKETNGGGKLISQIAGGVLGLDIPYYIRVDFAGFAKLIDELGGITVTVDKDLYDDKYPGPNHTYQVVDIKAGTYTMDGATALKYARSRQSTSDFDRARRQQKIILAVKAKATELNLLTNPAKVISIIDILSSHMETNLTLPELKRFVTLFKDMDLTKLVTKVFDDSPTGLLYGTKVDEVYVLRPVGDNMKIISDYVAQAISGDIKPEEISQPPSSQEPLKVEVLNGTNVTGLAKKMAAKLTKDGYQVVATGNNPTKGLTKTIVYDLSNGQRTWEVRNLATSLNADISTDKITTQSGALARVVLGSDTSL